MNSIVWLGGSIVESVTGAWPLVVLALLAFIPPARAIQAASADSRRAVARRAQRGWWFPLSLVVLGLVFAFGDTASNEEAAIGSAIALLGIPLFHVVWMIIAVGRGGVARGVVLSTLLAQLCVDVLVLMPAIGLATGFGRTWR